MKIGGEIPDSVPIDLIIEIFSRLPAKSIARFRCVSKLWGSMLHRPYFTELFLTRSWARPRLLFALRRGNECSIFSSLQLQNPYGKSSLVVSADFHLKLSRDMWPANFRGFTSGLIYFSSMQISKKKGVNAVPAIFNPRTRQYASLPKLRTDSGSRSFLGFDPIDKQLKVLSMAYPHSNEKEYHRILTLGTGKMSWRKIQCPLTHYPSSKWICINGVLYYLGKPYSASDETHVIVCFDVRSEKYKFIEAEECCYYDILINYKGKLGRIKWKYDGNGNTSKLYMWVLEDAEKLEWSKYVYTLSDDKIAYRDYVFVVGVTATGEIVLSMGCITKPFYVFYFSPERNTLRAVEIQGFGKYYYYDHIVSAFVDYVEDLNVNNAKYFKSSQCLNIIIRRRPKLPKPQNIYNPAPSLKSKHMLAEPVNADIMTIAAYEDHQNWILSHHLHIFLHRHLASQYALVCLFLLAVIIILGW